MITDNFDSIFNEQNNIELQNILKLNKKTITCAESCTGGAVSFIITSISGSSEIFNGSIVSYSNEIKNQELNVSKNTLEDFGAVSIQTVEEMLEGVIKKFNADYAIAISGIAGPFGATKNKPVGTVVIGICDRNNTKIVDLHYFSGSRQEVQIQAAKTALNKIFKFIQKSLDKKEKTYYNSSPF